MNEQNLLLRNDTFLGVCEAIGRDFGIHPNWLRIALSVALFFSPTAVILGYIGLGLAVAGARWAFPARSADMLAPEAAPASAPAVLDMQELEPEMSLAA